MDLARDFAFEPVDPLLHEVHLPFPFIPHPLGPLNALLGKWVGTGFNAIWRPFNAPVPRERFLELDPTTEELDFSVISGPIPNRGLVQPDMNMFGITYLQQIKNANKNAGIHIEPGIWAVVPATTSPVEPPSVVRMASIPHGTTLVAQGLANTAPGGPNIAGNNITPFLGAVAPVGNTNSAPPFPESNLSIATALRTPDAELNGPAVKITQAMVDNPNSLLLAAIAGQTIKQTTTLHVSTRNTAGVGVGGGTANTAFLGPNADATFVDAMFWIETVAGTNGKPDFLQLQYSQLVMLDFAGVHWPHVSVATLRKVVSLIIPPVAIDPRTTVPHIPPKPQPHPVPPGPGPAAKTGP